MPIIDLSAVTKADMAADTSAQLQALIEAGEGGTVADTFFTTLLIGDGAIGVISSLQDSEYSSTGLYSDPDFVVFYDDSVVDNLSETEMGIVVETYPYIELFDSSNTKVDLYASVSDFSAPTVAETDISNIFSVSYSSDEIAGLKERFGFSETFETLYDNAMSDAALAVSQTFLTKRFAFKKTQKENLSPQNFSSTEGVAAMAPMTGSAATAATTTMAGY
jgi:hypothetical protein